MHSQARKLQGRLAIIRQRRAHGQTVAADRGTSCALALRHLPLNFPHALDILLELGLGMPIGLTDRLGSFLEIVELAQLVRERRQDLLHRQANWALGIRHDGEDRHRQRLLDLAQQIGQVLLARTVEAAGKQHLTRERIAQHPEHILRLERLETINGQDDMPLLREALLETGLVSEAQGEQFFVARQEIGDRAWSDGDMLLLESGVDFGDGAVLTVAQGADVGNHIQAEFAMRQCPGTLFFGADGQMVVRTGWIGTAQDGDGEAGVIVEGGDRALRLVEVPQAAIAGKHCRRSGSKLRVRVMGGRLVRRAISQPPAINDQGTDGVWRLF